LHEACLLARRVRLTSRELAGLWITELRHPGFLISLLGIARLGTAELWTTLLGIAELCTIGLWITLLRGRRIRISGLRIAGVWMISQLHRSLGIAELWSTRL
jgi:hypothetical protein